MVASCRRVRPDSTGAPVVRDLLVDIVLMKIDLEALTIPQLEALIEQAHDLIDSKQKEAVTSARAEIQKIASTVGMSVEELLGLQAGKKALKEKKSVAVKYRNPKDHTQTWSGRGKQPRWLQEVLKQGGTLENFLAK
jgi:DNA-binding protein H-NS